MARLGRAAAPRRAHAAAAVLVVTVGAAALLRVREDAARTQVAVVPASAPGVAGAGAVPTPSGAMPAAVIDGGDEAPRPVAFVLHRPDARTVALVGDFNGWSPAAPPLASAGSGVWSVTLPLTPGRHAYGFVIDGETWVLDPQAPAARDADYGRDHSVVVVGVP